MELFFTGVLLGLSLSILVGPILFAIVQTSIEEGVKPGLAVASGIWISDILFVTTTYLGLSYVQQVTRWNGFELTLGTAGGIILILFGLGTFFSKPPKAVFETGKVERFSSWPRLVSKGFFINTINPFTVFIWTGVAATILTESEKSGQPAQWFYIGVLGTIFLTDSLKVLLAKSIRSRLKPNWILWVRRISGIALVVFGIALFVRVLL